MHCSKKLKKKKKKKISLSCLKPSKLVPIQNTMAQKIKKEETEFKAHKKTLLCINNCCFIGNLATNNMCQNCFNTSNSPTTTTTNPNATITTTNSSSSTTMMTVTTMALRRRTSCWRFIIDLMRVSLDLLLRRCRAKTLWRRQQRHQIGLDWRGLVLDSYWRWRERWIGASVAGGR